MWHSSRRQSVGKLHPDEMTRWFQREDRELTRLKCGLPKQDQYRWWSLGIQPRGHSFRFPLLLATATHSMCSIDLSYLLEGNLSVRSQDGATSKGLKGEVFYRLYLFPPLCLYLSGRKEGKEERRKEYFLCLRETAINKQQMLLASPCVPDIGLNAGSGSGQAGKGEPGNESDTATPFRKFTLI